MRSRDLATYSNTRTSETTRAVETLSTMMFRMMTAQDPNFALYPLRDDVAEDHLAQNEAVLRSQHKRILYRRKLLRACRGLSLFGTQPVEVPWYMEQSNGQIYFEGTDFVPRSLLQFAFDPAVPDIRLSDYHTVMDFVSAARLQNLAKGSPGVWDGAKVQQAVDECRDIKNINPRVVQRLQAAGYTTTDGKTLLMTTRWGLDEKGNEWVWTIINDKYVVRYHKNPFNHGRRPFIISSMIDFELEPYGYGVGNLGKRIQAEMDSNQNRNNDLMTFAQFCMWKASRTAGLRNKDMRMRPFKVIEMDDVNNLQEIRPSLEGLVPGLQHQDRLMESFRAVTGATTNLQAANTDATATEASITQNEAVRRVAVQSEIVAEDFVRQFVEMSMSNNAQFLDRPMWVGITGEDSPTMVDPATFQKQMGVEIKITTDKDFRPERTRRMIEYLQILTSQKANIPANVDVTPILEAISRDFGVNPKKVIKPFTAFDRMMEAVKQSQAMVGKVGGSIQNTAGGPGGGPGTITTPMGDVAGSPGGPSHG